MLTPRMPIIHNFPQLKEMRILLSSDMHRENANFDERRWNEFERLLQDPNTFCIFAGDQFEMALSRSKSSPYESRMFPAEAKHWWIEHMRPYASKVLCLIDGNHDYRVTRETSFYPLYDVALALGIETNYRSEAAFVDIGVGSWGGSGHHAEPVRYVFRVNHKAQNLVNYGTADGFDGIDVFVSGHTHKPMDKPLAKLCYDRYNRTVTERSVENFVCGSFLTYGGYGERGGMRPTSQKNWAIILDGNKKNIRTEGFYL